MFSFRQYLTGFGRQGLCPPEPQPLDDGGTYKASKLQRRVWRWWREFWDEWVPRVTHGQPFSVVCNGDALDGAHHNVTTTISNNPVDQYEIACEVLMPVVAQCKGQYYHVRGTESHVGVSASNEERLAKSLGAIPNDEGQHARWELWIKVGVGLVHVAHHIGTTGSNHYESTAVHKELVEAFTEAGRWKKRPPDVVVRSHRHRCIETRMPAAAGYACSLVTAGWQLKTPFAYRIAGGRQALPQIGGSIVRQGDEELHTRHEVHTMARPRVERG